MVRRKSNKGTTLYPIKGIAINEVYIASGVKFGLPPPIQASEKDKTGMG